MTKMRLYLRVTFVVALALLFLHRTSAFAQNNPLITVDENGHGTLLLPGGLPIPTQGVLGADPGPGGLSSVLTYNLLDVPGSTSTLAFGINNSGQVVGYFSNSTGTHGFLATPVPGPDSGHSKGP